jgi:poly(hydroxyalkanoate) depolymerase family esterase
MMKMNEDFLAAMHEATRLLQTAGPLEATAAIQRALGGAMPTVQQQARAPEDYAAVLDALTGAPLIQPDAFQIFKAKRNPEPGPAAPSVDVEDRGHVLTRLFSGPAGTREYKLYVPSGYHGQPLPLVVMLHGCTQNADDFAAGTRMNALAESQPCFVVYPTQSQSANVSKCWNWFKPDHQQRGQGEPSIIAGITNEVIETYKVDTRRVYVAGLSAGGAMAAVMADTYPELYAAVGVHSGLPPGAAHSLPSALAAMKGGTAGRGKRRSRPAHAAPTPKIPSIVFHGDADSKVHPCNGDQLVAAFSGGDSMPNSTTQQGQVPGGRSYTRRLFNERGGIATCEQWVVHGAPHAWSGGSPAGSYTDVNGPDASKEMLRFFLAHAKTA